MKNFSSKDVLPFVYVVGPVTLASTASGSQNLTIEASSFFEHHFWMASTDQDSVISGTLGNFEPNYFTCQITDQSSGRLLTSGQVPQRILFGPSNTSLRQIRPVIFPPNAVLQFNLTNLASAQTIVTICMVGYKLFNPSVV